MAAKVFEVGDILPATTQLRITSNNESINQFGGVGQIRTDNDNFVFCDYNVDFEGNFSFFIDGINYFSAWSSQRFVLVDTSSWSLSKRTVSTVSGVFTYEVARLLWEDLNPSSGFSITFEENGGTSVTDLTEQTALPDPLPTPTKANNVFAGWYLDSSFTQKAVAGAAIESDVTLYAKWYTPASWCKDIADAIREKEGSEEPIKHVDFAERISAMQTGIDTSDATATSSSIHKGKTAYVNGIKITGTADLGVELSQAEYAGLTPDDNTYYLINDGTPGSGSSGGVELIVNETSYGSSITLSTGELSGAGKEFFLQLEFGSGPDNIYCLTLDSTALVFILAKAAYYGMTTTVHTLRAIPDVIAGPISYTETVTVTVVDVDLETWAATVRFDIDIESYEDNIRAKLYSLDVK